MKPGKRIKLLLKFNIILFFLLVNINAQAQDKDECKTSLKKALDYFKDGKNEKVRPLIEPCLKNNNYSKTEKVTAYRLLTLSNLYDAEDSAAVESMRMLLKTEPEYEIDLLEDPSEFISLYKTFKTDPALILGVKAGIGLLNLYDINYFNDISTTETTIKYSTDLSYHGGIHFEIPIVSFLSVDPGIEYSKLTYSYDRTLLDFSEIKYKESVSIIDIPVFFQFNLLKKTKLDDNSDSDESAKEVKRNFMPYINIGATVGYLFNANVESVSKKDTKDGEEARPDDDSDIDVTDSRNPLFIGCTGGVGFRLKNVIGSGYFTFDVHYTRYFNNLVDRSNRFANDELTYDYYHTDNEFKFENVVICAGYSFPIYQAKQYKKFRK